MAEKPKKHPRKVSDAPHEKETRHSEEGPQSEKESDRLPRWRALKEEKGLRADADVALLLRLASVKYLE